jgi:hypothetical protein
MTVVKTRLDAVLVAILLALTAVAWCDAYGRWSPVAWALPAAYLEPNADGTKAPVT